MAGIVGINSSWLRIRNWAKWNADDITESGYCLNSKTMSNVPGDYGIFLCVTEAGTHTIQLYFTATNSNVIHYRNRTSGNWTSWQAISFI